jgi:sugar/nucleoside kinase (ribokinase family)
MAVDLVTLGLVCADVMVRPVEDFPERGKLSLVPHLEIHLGGLAGVTATVFCQLGGEAAFIGSVGADGFGEYILQAMKGQGVDCRGVRRGGETGSAATVVLVSEDGERTFLHHAGASRDFSEDDVDYDLVAQAKLVHWGGPAVTPKLDGEPMGRVLKKARELGVKTSMDTCYDGEGKWFSRIEHALPNLDIVMTSLEEARMYTERETPEQIADFFLGHGAETAVVKLGGDGMFVKNGSESHHLPSHDVPVIDTTGAGDASCAGFLFGYLKGWDLLRCGRLANAVGALTVQRMGGAEAIDSPETAFRMMESD